MLSLAVNVGKSWMPDMNDGVGRRSNRLRSGETSFEICRFYLKDEPRFLRVRSCALKSNETTVLRTMIRSMLTYAPIYGGALAKKSAKSDERKPYAK